MPERAPGVRAAFRWLGRHELGSVLSLLVVAVATLVFAAIADVVGVGVTRNLDRALLLALRSPTDLADPIGPPGLEEAARDVTALGGPTVLTLVTVAAVGYLVLSRKRGAAAFVAVSVVGGVLLSNGLKVLFSRPRPDIVPHLVPVVSPSFPSGHSMMSAVVYLTLGVLLARLHVSLLLKAYVLLCSLLLAILVGVSRVYIGVHWPTDVLGGWAAGAAWAALCWFIARALQRRGSLPRDVHVED